MTTRKLLPLIGIAVVALIIAACAPATPTAKPLTKVTAIRDWPVIWPMQMYYEVGIEQGYFADAGLDVTFEFPPQPADVVKLVGTGQAEFGFVNTVDAINAKLQGLDILVVAAAVPRDMGGIMYFKDSGMTSPADLRGKIIANYAWPQTQLHLRAMLEHYGLTTEDVTIVDAGDYSVPLMVAGQVDAADAAVGGEDLDTYKQTGREVGNWLYTEHGVPPFYTSLIITNRRFAEQNPELVTGFIEACFKAIDYTKANLDAAVELNVSNHPDADPNWLRDGWKMGIEPFLSPYPEDEGKPRGTVSIEVVQRYMDFLYEGGLLDQKIDPATFIDMSYLPSGS